MIWNVIMNIRYVFVYYIMDELFNERVTFSPLFYLILINAWLWDSEEMDIATPNVHKLELVWVYKKRWELLLRNNYAGFDGGLQQWLNGFTSEES